jgi:hypothetical protein
MGESDKDIIILSCYQISGLLGSSVLASREAFDSWLPPARPWPACAEASAKASGQVAQNGRKLTVHKGRGTGGAHSELPLFSPFGLY